MSAPKLPASLQTMAAQLDTILKRLFDQIERLFDHIEIRDKRIAVLEEIIRDAQIHDYACRIDEDGECDCWLQSIQEKPE